MLINLYFRVMRHVPICGYNYDPPAPEPKDEFVIGERYAPANPPETRPKVCKSTVVFAEKF
jgi:hypothetical protein